MSEPPSPRVVRLTPPGRGAIASLLVEGPGAREILESRFHPASGRPLASYAVDRLAFGHFDLGLPSQPGEEVVVRCRSGGAVELHCHGGYAAVARIEKMLLEQGCRPVSWQDWATDHHQDTIAAAARVALADARTERTAAVLLDQFNGALRRAVEAIRQSLEAGDAASAGQQLGGLLAHAETGMHLVRPWRVVLAGPPNVGKSSLINALVGYQRAIVHRTAGTTRDVVSATTAVDGWPLELSDTAGLRETEHAVEQAGIELAQRKLASAELVVLVFDSSQPWSSAEGELIESHPGAMVVHNKCDLPPASGPPRSGGLSTSALTGWGIGELVGAIARRLVPDPPPPGAAVPFTADQVDRLRAAADAEWTRGVSPGVLERVFKLGDRGLVVCPF